MKKIKIRFIQREKDFILQRKTWYGWKYIRYWVDTGYESINYIYRKDSKEELLKEVLEHHYKIDKRFVTVTEYPTIKTY